MIVLLVVLMISVVVCSVCWWFGVVRMFVLSSSSESMSVGMLRVVVCWVFGVRC